MLIANLGRWGNVIHRHAQQIMVRHFYCAAFMLVCLNAMLSCYVISQVQYTEIDWKAYMEEVGGVLNDRQFDYIELKGGTGPLVYPAGFVYIYSLLYYMTDQGRQVRTAQAIFACLQSALLAFVLIIYRRCFNDHAARTTFPLWIVAFLFISRRVMSLFVLRLFNDGVQMLILYISIVLFTENKWNAGCLLYSLSVSVKMNALLFAPGLAVLLCQARGFGGALRRILAICLSVQLILGAPFLLYAPKSYISRAFEITRVFFHKWSVNGALLPEEIFLDNRLAASLLLSHLSVLLLFGHRKWTSAEGNGLFGLFRLGHISSKTWIANLLAENRPHDLNANHIVSVMFASNFIGILFARTLHYQFYLWYAHSLPFLVWRGSLHWVTKVAILLTIEAVFNIYPPHPLAATALHMAHTTLLYSLWKQPRATEVTIYKPVPRSKNPSSHE